MATDLYAKTAPKVDQWARTQNQFHPRRLSATLFRILAIPVVLFFGFGALVFIGQGSRFIFRAALSALALDDYLAAFKAMNGIIPIDVVNFFTGHVFGYRCGCANAFRVLGPFYHCLCPFRPPRQHIVHGR